uniref:Large ribosomal subunit protein mL49 n=1 Tax=Angiostrongylus cantonensis TaxID=6313 RepID=A0A0K0CT04_ANGCA
MLRSLCRVLLTRNSFLRTLSTATYIEDDDSKPWINPWRHAVPETIEEYDIDWSFVERLMPHDVVPPLPVHESYPTPNPPPDLPYYVRRKRDHTLPLYLNLKKDQLNEKTLDIDHVELVTMKGIEGDVFACEADLRQFLECELNRPVATHIDELKGRVVVKGADRSLVEKFLFSKGF